MLSDDFLKPTFFRVTRKIQETPDTFTFELAPPEKMSLAFAPGQFNMLYAFGVGEVPVSMSGDPGSTESYWHTIKVVGNVTKALSRLEAGDPIGVRGPFGKPWPLDSCRGKDIVIIAGGIGLAPLRSFVYHLIKRREEFGRVALLYGSREPSEIVFFEELDGWKKKLDHNVHVTVDFASPEWRGNVGVVTNLLPQVPFPLDDAIGLLCGPEIMLRFAASDLNQRGMRSENIFLAMERNMKCAIGHCGRCQYLDNFVCKDGSILPYSKVGPFLSKKEI